MLTRCIARTCVIALVLCMFVLPVAISNVSAEEEVVKIGAIYPLTGSLASTGRDFKNALILAQELVNEEYDIDLPMCKTRGIPSIGAKLEIVLADSQGSPNVGQAEAERLITQQKVVALVGCYQSAVTKTASQVAERYQIPFFNVATCGAYLHLRGLKWFFRCFGNDIIYSDNMFTFFSELRDELRTQGKDLRTVMVVHENTEWGSSAAEAVTEAAEKHGFTVVEKLPYSATQTDLTAEVARIKARDPDIVQCDSYTSDSILMMTTFKKLDYTPKAIINHNAGFVDPAFIETLGGDSDYTLVRSVFVPDVALKKPLAKQINDLFKEKFGYELNDNAASTINGILVLADAIDRAGSTDPENLRRAILETDIGEDQTFMPWQGVRFDPNTGQNTRASALICQIIGGHYYIVWPKEYATRQVVYPAPTWDERQ